MRGDRDGPTRFHDLAASLFARLKAEDLAVLNTASAGVTLYGNAILASSKLIVQNPKVIAAFPRVTNRALVETFANLAPAIAAINQREPFLDDKVELERWRITAQYVGALDTATHGLGDIRKLLLEQQVDEVAEVFGLKTGRWRLLNRPKNESLNGSPNAPCDGSLPHPGPPRPQPLEPPRGAGSDRGLQA